MELKLRNTGDLTAQKFNAVILGESGVGKTYLIRTLPNPEKILYVNISPLEDGTLSISDLKIDVYDIKTIEDAETLLTFLKTDTKYEIVYVDGLTALSRVSIEHFEKLNEDNKNGFVKFDQHAKMLTGFLLALKSSGKHVILTCLPAVKQTPTGMELYSFDISGQSFTKNLEARVDAVLAMGIDEDGNRLFLTQNNNKWVAKVRTPANVKLEKLEPADLGKLMTKLGFLKSENKENLK
jgi:hypothetical protein